jgi:hypothetical protein
VRVGGKDGPTATALIRGLRGEIAAPISFLLSVGKPAGGVQVPTTAPRFRAVTLRHVRPSSCRQSGARRGSFTTEPNAFGTDECIGWCQKAGIEPMLAVMDMTHHRDMRSRSPD